ncbi:redoxin domain-containing protein [Salipaludibacillus agaradhaerens]|uniref:TlpA family protein disulfide reductase n=1 Tax=Salipaludibacillus agaradhaerens TaxID=76935 RepID=UPI002150EAAB|nr:redoxin family protein [Salipaludibacillus agaradhaerens]MCR6107393.1 redoxin domain-containing protein [Salipaludibacillus agaradhaerens]MCR6119422.1 redoxin domain-containing protein [Salipaludibacillus agaradhaerens]UJW58451.1 redoxin domain-containing protein [Bacillus sp. A116_S68]
MNKIGVILIVFILAGMGYTAYSFVFNDSSENVTTVNRINGEEPINLENYIGQKKTILQFVAVPCECCSYSMPFIQEFIASQSDIEVITIVFFGKEREILDKFENEYKATHLWGVDPKRDLANYYNVSVSPTYVFFDEKGNELGTHPYIIATSEELGQRYEEAYESYHHESGPDNQ